MMTIKNKKYNSLTAIKLTDKRLYKQVVWVFKCDCGRIIEKPGSLVVRGRIKNCGNCGIEDERYVKVIKLYKINCSPKKIATLLNFTITFVYTCLRKYEKQNHV